MKTQFKTGVFITAIAVLGAIISFSAHQGSSRSGERAPAAAETTAAGHPASLSTQVQAPRQSSATGSIRMEDPDRFRISIGDPLFEPRTEDEVLWLTRNSYPSQAERDHTLGGAPNEHALHAADGVTPTEIVQAEQLAVLFPDKQRAASSFLKEAAIQGSIFALESMARMLSHPRINNPVQSEAYFRAATLRGDWNIHLRAGKSSLSSENDLLADLLAQQIIENINLQRRNRGLAPLYPDPRPGLDEFLDEIARTNRSGN